MNSFYELASKRQSCRNYTDKPVEKDKLMKCINAAFLAPSAYNGQLWHYTLVINRETASKLAKTLQSGGMNKFTDKTPAFAVITQKASNASATIGGKLKHQDYSSMDIGISTAHFVLQAEDLGLSTCIIGWFNEKDLKSLLSIKETDRIRLVIAVGYKDESDKFRTKRRKPEDEVLKVIE